MGRIIWETVVVPLPYLTSSLKRLGYMKELWEQTSGTIAQQNHAGMWKRALKVIESVEGVITPFDICSAASKPETTILDWPTWATTVPHFRIYLAKIQVPRC